MRQRWETPPSGSSLGADAAPKGERTRAAADPDLQAAVDLLVATGCPRRTSRGKGAVDAVQAALAGGWTSAKIREQVSGWLAYARCQETIHHAGFFTAARLRDRDPAPERPPKTADELAREHLARMYDRVVVR